MPSKSTGLYNNVINDVWPSRLTLLPEPSVARDVYSL